MSKSVLLGAADGYDWNDVRPWVLSARQSGFEGDIYLILYRVKGNRDELLRHLEAHNVNVYEVHHDPYMRPIVHEQKGSPTQSHNLRFYHAWELLSRLEEKYKFVIMTDVRDVIFQRDPNPFLFKYPGILIAPSEGIKYADEDWNKQNLINGFGPIFWDLRGKEWLACNVGTIAGLYSQMVKLFHLIFTMTEGRYYPSDQSSFNVLLNTLWWGDCVVTHKSYWAAQLGTTQDPTKAYLWDRLCEPRPEIRNDGFVYNPDGIKFTIVHQWDRVPQLKPIILERYK
jgi:hypothetical protein